LNNQIANFFLRS